MIRHILYKLLIALLFAFNFTAANAQDARLQFIEERLRELSKGNPGLNEKVELSVNNIPVPEFIRALAVANNLNITVDPSIKGTIINNFSNVSVMDVLLFLVRRYDLDASFIGNIISFSPYATPPPEPVKYEPKKLAILYDAGGNTLTMDLKDDSLFLVVKEITKLSGKNVLIAPAVSRNIVSGYIQQMSFDNALDKLAFANDLKVTRTEDNFYLIEKRDAEAASPTTSRTTRGRAGQPASAASGAFNFTKEEDRITVDASNVPILDIINTLALDLDKDYFLFTEPKGNATLNIADVTFDEFLSYLLNGTDYTFRTEEGIYLIGERNLEGLRATRVLTLQHRTIDKVIDFIPPDLKKGIDIKTFPDLNSFIVSGSLPRINEVEAFLRDIDRVVPVIMIEVLIMDVKRTRTVATGIDAGLGEAPVATGGTLYPGVNFTLNSRSLNNLISSFNGFGIFNLGKVTPNFYLTIQAMEEQGMIDMHSTPKLATLNGHEATMSIGKTEYYLEIQNNVIGTQNPQNIVSQQYKSVNADLSLTINPIVSSDDQVTLDIQVEQSDFTARINPNAPPGMVKRNFQSLIRVRNEEMVVLGGLEEEGKNETSRGIPLLSRIPILKWIFSSRIKQKSKGRLTLFIKPTIIY